MIGGLFRGLLGGLGRRGDDADETTAECAHDLLEMARHHGEEGAPDFGLSLDALVGLSVGMSTALMVRHGPLRAKHGADVVARHVYASLMTTRDVIRMIEGISHGKSDE